MLKGSRDITFEDHVIKSEKGSMLKAETFLQMAGLISVQPSQKAKASPDSD